MIYTAYITKADKDLAMLYKTVGRDKFRKMMRLSLLALSDPSCKLQMIQCYEMEPNVPQDMVSDNVVRICMRGRKWDPVRIFFEKSKDHSSFMKTIFRLMLGPKILIPLFCPQGLIMQETQSLMIGQAIAAPARKKKAVKKSAGIKKQKLTPQKEIQEERKPLKVTILPEKEPETMPNPSIQTFSMEDEFTQEQTPGGDTDILSMLNNLFG